MDLNEYNEERQFIMENAGLPTIALMRKFAEYKVKNCNKPAVIVSFLSDMPENKPLYKDSGLWQLRTDDMNDVILQQASNESDNDFIERCKEIQRTKEINEL